MDWLANIASGGLSGIFGGVLGLFGTCIQAWSAHKQKEQELEANKARWQHDEKVLQIQGEQAIREAEAAQKMQVVKEEGMNQRSADSIQIASYQHDKPLTAGQQIPDSWMGKNVVYPLFATADWLVRMTRPMLTIFYSLFIVYLYITTTQIIKGYLALSNATNTVQQFDAALLLNSRIIDMALFLACTATVWWFGGRALNMAQVRNK